MPAPLKLRRAEPITGSMTAHGPMPPDEPGRLRALAELALDASEDAVLEGLVQVAADLLGAPVSSVNVVDDARQWVKAAVGAERGSGPPRGDSFCTLVVADGAPVVIEDVRREPRVAARPAVLEGAVGSYAGMPVATSDGHVIGTFCVWGPEPRGFSQSDLTTLRSLAAATAGHLELRRASRKLARTSAKLHAVLEHAPDAFIAMDGEGRVVDWNREAEAMFGWSRDEALGRSVAELIIPEDLRASHAGGLDRYRRTGELTVLHRPVEVPAVRRDGTTVEVELRIAAVPSEDGEHFNAFARDIGVRKAMEREREGLVAQLEQLSRTDPLTGAANRRVLTEELERELARAGRAGTPLSVVLLDLDHFKAFNDQHGHAAGDRLLAGAVEAWRPTLRDTDLLARYGGEEFVVVLPGCDGPAALMVAGRLDDLIPEGRSCSAGVACWDGAEALEVLLARADAAMYAAKAAGRAAVRLAPAPQPA